MRRALLLHLAGPGESPLPDLAAAARTARSARRAGGAGVVVPSAVAHLAEAQFDGAAYVRV